MTITRSQFHALAWAALFTEANIEGYAMNRNLIIGSSLAPSECLRFARKHERFFITPNGQRRLHGGMVPTTLFKKMYAQRLKRLGITIVKDPVDPGMARAR
jgi:hypothetical protein